MITLIQLEYIVAVNKYRNFAKASEHCFVTQPTLSMQIKKLEEDLGVKIFDRSVLPVRPTIIGEEIILQAKNILDEASRLQDIVKVFINEVEGDLHIGVIPTLGPYLLPLFAGHLKRQFPKVNLKIEELVTEDIIKNLKNNNLDAGILVTPYQDKDIVEVPVFYEEMLIYAHKDHPLLKEDDVDIDNISTDDIWLLNEGHCFRSQVINLCAIDKNHRNTLPYELEGGSLDTLLRVINQEGGFTIIPELCAIEMITNNAPTIRHFSNKIPLREVSVCHSPRFPRRQLIDILITEIKSALPAHMLNSNRGETVTWR